jgi:hypothetical protein
MVSSSEGCNIGEEENGLLLAVLSSPRATIHQQAEYKQSTCSICLERYDATTNPAMLYECGHAYHLQCAETWRQKSSFCPLCWRDLIEHGLYTGTQQAASDSGNDSDRSPEKFNSSASRKKFGGNLSSDSLTESDTEEVERSLVRREMNGTYNEQTSSSQRRRKKRCCCCFHL